MTGKKRVFKLSRFLFFEKLPIELVKEKKCLSFFFRKAKLEPGLFCSQVRFKKDWFEIKDFLEKKIIIFKE